MNGRYLDLHEHYFTFINSKFGKQASLALNRHPHRVPHR
jgi:hypothetical protein